MKTINILLVLISMVLVSCYERPKVTEKDIAIARCICNKRNVKLNIVWRDSSDYFSFTCEDRLMAIHYDDSYTEGCQ